MVGVPAAEEVLVVGLHLKPPGRDELPYPETLGEQRPAAPSREAEHFAPPMQQPGFQQRAVPLRVVQRPPRFQQGRIDHQAALAAGAFGASQAGRPEQQVQPTDVRVRSLLWPLEAKLDGAAQAGIEVGQRLHGQQVVLARGLDAVGPDDVQQRLEIAEDSPRALLVDGLLPEDGLRSG